MKKTEKYIKIAIIGFVVYATIMMLHWPIGFTYFTQLSNLFAGYTVFMQLLKTESRKVWLMKYMATVSVFITGTVFLFILAPLDRSGFIGAYLQDHFASLCMHFIVPVLTVFDFIKNDSIVVFRKKDIKLSMLPFYLYFIFILILGKAGVRWYGNMMGPYPFINYGAATGWFGLDPFHAEEYSLGIGVAYIICIMSGMVYWTGWFLWKIKQRYTKMASPSL